ncbi:hypothetical protein KQI82_05170 [Oscillibacter sp. MSJ-2]|uniref:Uncharacterized protein n=1 Tax=Dysosmobacter acutus TaxID=2841504 RepID=A0ABS6F7Q9_9FIRM|nr:hypothetical protein [Dysosmobacter acutus]MBU5626312.1 hypothetical protein [Dysosmobacter acutus]
MKKFVFGVMLAVIGLMFAAICFVHALCNPWNYNGIDGLLGSFLGTDTLIPFVISLLVLIAGVVICGREAYRRK